MFSRTRFECARQPRREVRPTVELLEDRCLLNAGDLDPTFDFDGRAITPFPSHYAWAEDVAIDAGNRIVSIGTEGSAGSRDFAVVRYNPDGSLDTTFGTNGRLTVDLGGDDFGREVALGLNGEIYVVGTSIAPDFTSDLALVAVSPTGTIVFQVTTDFGFSLSSVEGNAVAVRGNGKIVVGGESDDFLVAQFLPSGVLDTASFGGGDGWVQVDFFGYTDRVRGLAISGGKIVAAGEVFTSSTASSIGLVRLSGAGVLDGTFGAGGKVVHSFTGQQKSVASGLLIQNDGKILAVGWGLFADYDIVLARFAGDGVPDSNFGVNGSVITDLGGHDFGADVALRTGSGTRIVVSGWHNPPTDDEVALVRYKLNGTLDSAFGNAGVVLTDFGNTFDYGGGLAIQPTDKKIVVVGQRYVSSTDSQFLAARYDNSNFFAPQATRPQASAERDELALLPAQSNPIAAATTDLTATSLTTPARRATDWIDSLLGTNRRRVR